MILAIFSIDDLALLKVFYFIKIILNIISIVVPIILVVMGTIDLVKAIVNGNGQNSIKKYINILVKRIIIGVMIFFLIPIVSLVMNFVGQQDFSKTKYWTGANKETIDTLSSLKDAITYRTSVTNKIKKLKEIQSNKIKNIVDSDDLETAYAEVVKSNNDSLTKSKETIQKQIENLEKTKSKLDTEKNSEEIELINIELSTINYTLNNLEEEYSNINKDALVLHDEKEEEIKKAEQERIEKNKKYEETNNSSNNTYTPNSSESSDLRDQIVEFALKYVGNRYVYGGNSLTNGIDCSGFTQQVYKHFGISIPRTAATQPSAGREVSLQNVKKGDLIFYRGQTPKHVSIYIGGGKIVHAKGKKYGIVVDKIYYGNTPSKAVTYIND